MYGALWRALPGPAAVKALLVLALAAGVVYVCFEWFFPWLNDWLAFNDPVVG